MNPKPKTWVGDVTVVSIFCLGILLLGGVIAFAGAGIGGDSSPGSSSGREGRYKTAEKTVYRDYAAPMKTDSGYYEKTPDGY